MLAAPAGNFFSPAYEQLAISEIRGRASTATASADRLTARLFLGEALTLSGQIHSARAIRAQLVEECDSLFPGAFESLSVGDRADAALICAMGYVEENAGSRAAPPTEKILALLLLARKFRADPQHLLYAEGRIFSQLPPGRGQNFGKSLIAFEMLRRMDRQHSSPSYWIARVYQWQGNREKALENYRRAFYASPPDARASHFFDGETLIREHEAVDGLGYGWSPQLIASPGRGFGASLFFFDDRLFDTNRSGHLQLSGASRGSFLGAAALTDRATLAGFSLEPAFDFYYGNEDFFGVGADTASTHRQTLTVQKMNGRLAARVLFGRHFSFALGWRVTQARLVEGTVNLPDAAGITCSGPFAEIRFDERDSARFARRGWAAALRGFFPTRDLGSPRTFELWEVEAQGFLPLGLRQELSLTAAGAWGRREVPFAAYPRLSPSMGISGVREGRLLDRAVVAVSPEYALRIGGPFRGSLFGVAATAADEVGGLGQSTWRLGGGASLTYFFTIYRSPFARAEIAYFGDETIFQVVGGIGF